MSFTVKNFTTDGALLDYFCREICQKIEAAIAARGAAYIVVSGGRTPVPLFEKLAMQMLPWSKITIVLADERWVEPSDANSNERLVRTHLMHDQAAAAKFISLWKPNASAYEAEPEINQRLAAVPTFDVVILGMGEDGHTASLFPCSADIKRALNTHEAVVAVTPTTAPHTRMSLSLKRLLNSHQIYFHLSGANKAGVLKRVVANQQAEALPASAVLHQTDVPVEVVLSQAEDKK